MKKFMLSILLLMCIDKASFSQLTHSITLGPDLGFPTKTLGKANLGFGGSVEYRLKFSAPVAIQLHAGYMSFTNKIYSNQKVSFVPLRAGVVGTIYRDIFFVFADAGTSHYHSISGDPDRNGFSFGAGAGYNYPIGNRQLVQVSGYYNLARFKRETSDGYYEYNWFTVRIAYGLSFGKGKK